jgi:hypothetical protein
MEGEALGSEQQEAGELVITLGLGHHHDSGSNRWSAFRSRLCRCRGRIRIVPFRRLHVWVQGGGRLARVNPAAGVA